MISKQMRFIAMSSLMVFAVLSFSLPALARWGDGTGPEGLGPKTGRGAGYCAGYSVPGYQNTTVSRRGFGRALFYGGGKGNRNIYKATGLTRWQPRSTNISASVSQPTITKEQQMESLKNQAEFLKNELEKISRQINDLESENNKR
ncbi:DUF5320 domain-containing protein [Candidatus Latescibacterota bacterium]